ncbi:MAG TPA: SDR family oxidoreductase [Actinomycetota bacterium]|jgi:short-subunit dehydrogenase|nr:SDR family oxidoreductase [Micrococcales bacterium]MCO5300445.1 SDR family oxidoreductase [Candidatus Nanopelagicales bacterium]HPQ83136.1 SDR family oxidoreductase [Actinomycetota bacterium]HRY11659.1 SDR family oxidoreductase [Candidatus Nanopelagicales bacterium]
MTTALVTGATSGIGLHFARRLAADGHDLVLVARTASNLEGLAAELGEQHGITAETLQADLTRITDCRRVEQRLSDPERPVDLLINNAGFGLYDGDFADHDIRAEDDLLMVNVRAVMRLTHAALGPMLERGTGSILNVSSVASFAPDAVAPTYAASKAWVTSFSQGLREQVSGSGVRVLALTPGLVPTGFQDRAGVQAHVPGALWLDPDDVVDTALKDLAAGRGVSIPGLPYRAVSLAMRLTPRSIYLPLSNSLLRRLT